MAPGTMYEALARLERQGLIEPLESNDRRRPYRLTPEGASRSVHIWIRNAALRRSGCGDSHPERGSDDR